MYRFDVLDHTADAGIIAYGNDIKEAFASTAYGMFSLIAELSGIKPEVHRNINLEAPDRESLLVDWLNELLYIFDVEHIIFSRFHIHSLTRNSLRAEVSGEQVDLMRHRLKTEIKAATYHMLEIERGAGYRIQVILDM